MLLIRAPACGTVLHTGDCRIEAGDLPRLLAAVAAAGARGDGGAPPPPLRGRSRGPRPPPIDILLLDNTLCHPTIRFPPRADVARAAVEAATSRLFSSIGVVVDAIGKEELLACLATALGVPCVVGDERAAAATAAGLPGHLFDTRPRRDTDPSPRLTVVSRRLLAPFAEAAAEAATRDAPALLLVPSGLGSLRPGWWRGALGRDAPAAAVAAGSLVAVELPYSLHGGFDETVALVAALRPRWVQVSESERGGEVSPFFTLSHAHTHTIPIHAFPLSTGPHPVAVHRRGGHRTR